MLIGIIGPAGAGKSTIARILVEEYGFQRLPFAGPLKRMLGPGGLGLPMEALDGDRKEEAFPLLSGHTARYAMQRLGTEWGRHCMGADFWVNCWEADYVKSTKSVVVDDVRFPNEVETIHRWRGIVIKVVGRSAAIAGSSHVSEKIISGEDFTLDNHGSIDALAIRVGELVIDITSTKVKAAFEKALK